jgi:imidazolonepropionase-like amidohydrolase
MVTLLRRGQVWNGLDSDYRRTDIVLDSGTIAELVPAGTYRPSSDDTVFELDEAFVLPGLIDAHVHLVWGGSSDPVGVVDAEGEQFTVIRAAVNAQRQLCAGVTTLRDLGSNWDISVTIGNAIDRSIIDGPSIIAAGRTVIMTGGHDAFWGIPSDGVDAVVSAVRQQVRIGAKVIKSAATGGAYGRAEGEDIGQAELSYEELRAIAHEAHRFGLKTAAHALGAEGVRNAILAGFDTIEHGVFLDEEMVAEMVRRGTVLSPTVATYRVLAGSPGVPEYARKKARTVVEAHKDSVAMAYAAGVPVVAGTDAGAPDLPGPAIVDELLALESCGLSRLDALKAATSTAGEALGRPALGTLTRGAVADLVVLKDDPLSSLENLRKVEAVIRGGRRWTSTTSGFSLASFATREAGE